MASAAVLPSLFPVSPKRKRPYLRNRHSRLPARFGLGTSTRWIPCLLGVRDASVHFIIRGQAVSLLQMGEMLHSLLFGDDTERERERKGEVSRGDSYLLG